MMISSVERCPGLLGIFRCDNLPASKVFGGALPSYLGSGLFYPLYDNLWTEDTFSRGINTIFQTVATLFMKTEFALEIRVGLRR